MKKMTMAAVVILTAIQTSLAMGAPSYNHGYDDAKYVKDHICAGWPYPATQHLSNMTNLYISLKNNGEYLEAETYANEVGTISKKMEQTVRGQIVDFGDEAHTTSDNYNTAYNYIRAYIYYIFNYRGAEAMNCLIIWRWYYDRVNELEIRNQYDWTRYYNRMEWDYKKYMKYVHTIEDLKASFTNGTENAKLYLLK